MQKPQQSEKQLREWLSTLYYDLNGSHVDVLERPPSALAFSRLAHIARPVVVRGFHTPAHSRWTDNYLVEKMGNRPVSIAVTPNGLADAVTADTNGRLFFVEPFSEQIAFESFMKKLAADDQEQGEVLYLQSQNGNLFSSFSFESHSESDDWSEFEPLRLDVPPEVPWCSEAFGKHPDAVNLWIGDGRSVTSIHSDPYENIYTVVRGTKHFTLLPPTDGLWLKERMYSHATYTRSSSGDLSITASSSVPPVRWSSIANPHLDGALPLSAHPVHITLEAGDTLYLPAGWWHHVRQTGFTIALNWWYDMETRGMTWVWLAFLRGVGEVPDGTRGNSDEGGGETHSNKEVESA